MENFVLNGNGQIDINRKGMDSDYKFHLQEINHNTEICSNKDACDDTATSISSYSNYKQRIDAMFDDSRSVFSDMSRSDTKRKLPMNHQQTRSEMTKERVIANNIQEKIEKMFEQVSVNGSQKNDSKIKGSNQGDHKASSDSKHDFTVTYLGSKPLLDKNVSLISLQDPLKQLYFEYKKNPPGEQLNILTISKEGLKIKVSEKEELNPFPTIAVWASVKLSFRVTANTTEYAFLPLITDPDGIDKNLLFRELKTEDKQCFKDKLSDDNQSPIFTVVMKNINIHKQLECHGFICKSSEEAIVIAANLYQTLMKKLKRKKEQKEQRTLTNNEKEAVIELAQSEENRTKPKVKVKKPAPPVPLRAPRKPEEEKISTLIPPKGDSNVINKSEENSEKTTDNVGKVPQRRGSMPSAGAEPVRTLRRTVSERRGNGIIIKKQNEGGDILTKVAIPRSSSFLNANGPLSRFSGRSKTNPKNEVASPLGFKELFNEFRIHEGLESMDDILNAIIDAEGMSFNDLKPIYKEFLLKLAVTLTKDELYQRSKVIMRRQKKRNKNCSFRKKAFISSIGLHKIFRKTASRLGKTKSQRPNNLEFTSIVFQSSSKQFDSNLSNIRKRKSNSFRVKRKQSSRRRLAKRLEKAKIKHVSTTSEDSDFFQPKKNTSDSGGGPNRSSSGYFSCSECSCDSEKCTCTRTDKCYCTLGHKKSYVVSSSDESKFLSCKKSSFRLVPQSTTDHEIADSLKSCSCDTDSCIDSGKCYCTQNKEKRLYNSKIFRMSDKKGICQTPHLHQKEKLHNDICQNFTKKPCKMHGETNFDQLKDHEFTPSDTILSRAASPRTAWLTNERNMKQKPRLKASSSLELLNNRPKSYHFECPRYPDFEEHLKEIQNTCHGRSYCETARHSCFHGADVRPSFYPNGTRQYSSMRCRSDFLNDDLSPLQRSISYRTKNFFNSVRSKHSCDNIMNHIKFPNNANSSLQFTQRMDVYNSFSENRRRFPENEFVCFSHCKENRRHAIHELPPNDPHFHKGNFQKLDYHLFTIPKSEGTDSKANKKKVLVVSARDPKGKVLYMGTSSRCDSSFKNLKNFTDSARTNASEALAVKKSAEIAALFSDVTPKQKLNYFDYAKDQKQNNCRARSHSYRSTNLENTLGYLP